MPEQTVKHDNTASGFLLVLIPVAFFAVFVSVAWPFIVGATLLFTGNNVWQSYQLAKLSQQVNPFFNQLIIEKQGSITPLELSVRANIPGKVASRYLSGKAVEFGGTSQQSASQGVVYNFLTVNSLENVFSGINPNPTATQKLAEFDAPTTAVATLLPTPIVQLVVQPVTATPPILEVVVAPPPAAPTDIESVPIDDTATETVLEPIDAAATETTVELITEPAGITAPLVPSVIDPPAQPEEILPISAFGQALRGIFNAEHAEVTDPEETDQASLAAPEISNELGHEIISQADLAKRLDVHASTIYKRRADVSFSEWTRNRDPEGVAWGYSRDSKEFYRLD
jgi:hypothetical protein